VSDEDTYPLSTEQDKNWKAPKLMTLGAIALAIALAIIYTAASVRGEQPNQWPHLEERF
jgi:hypothetical protein